MSIEIVDFYCEEKDDEWLNSDQNTEERYRKRMAEAESKRKKFALVTVMNALTMQRGT